MLAARETMGPSVMAIDPSCLRTATDMHPGARIMTPSMTAWPPM